MAEPAVLTTLGWVVSPLMKMLFDKAHDHLGTGIDDRRKMLAATVLPRLSLAIEKAEKSDNKAKLEDWLKRLKDAYYKAEEAIDLFEYEMLKQKVKDDRKTLKQKIKTQRGTRVSLPSQFLPRIKIASKIMLKQKIVSKIKLKGRIKELIEIATEANEFRDLLEAQENTTRDPDRETISQPSGRVFGREKDKENVAGLLTEKPLIYKPEPSTKLGIPIIAITGRSGIGKTTLAQYVYQYVKEQYYFDLLLWVHVPRKFKAADLIKSTLQNIQAKDGAPHLSNNIPSVSLEALSEQIKRLLGSKKFLLILDDFWCDVEDDMEQWEKFISCLSGWLPGSKILLTTQSVRAVKQASLAGVTEIKTYSLQELEEDQFLELFMHHAWPSDYSMQREDFENIGRKIASKLKGDPGAAKIVGRQLREKPNIRHWEEIAEKDWLRDSMKARIWSYQQLHVHLQHCFAICCLFPKGTCFPSQLLIRFWMAEGFIKPVNKEDRMEDIGENYLNELVCRFFLEQRVDDGQRIYYRLHDLLHDLAERVQGDDFLRIDYTKSRNVSSHISQMLSRTENIRHIYLPASMINKLKDTICLMKNLRTLVCVEANCTISKKVLREILKNSKKMRVLFLPMCGDDLPDCFGNLKLLRLLCFVGCLSFKKLPVSICKLYLLETLALPSCESLPKEFSELICLRHVAMEEETICHISNVGRMTSLQGLSILAIRKKRGHELHQLENLIQLRGTMCITGLENVTSIEDAIKANMLSKSHLEELEFQWNSDERMVDDFQLLDALQPHPNIRGLTIKRFGANRLPNWILGLNSLKHLVELKLIGCTNIEKISSIYESLPNCKLLDLSGLNNLKELPLLPPNLSSLTLHHIPQLGYFSENDLLKKKERKQFMLEVVKQIIGYMKSRYLKLSYEPIETSVRRCLQFVKERLEATPEICIMSSQCENIFTKMKKIDPWNKCYSKDELLEAWDMCMHCHLETMLNKNEESMLVLPASLTCLVIKACSITSDALSTCIQCLVSLSEVCLVEIQTITSLPPEEALHSLKNLRSLHIKRCHLLSSLGGIRALTSLTELTLKGCLNLNSSNEQLPSSLETLKFEECANVDFILDQSDLPELRVLEVWEFFYVGHLYEGREKGVLLVGHLPCLQDLTLVGWNGHLEGLNSLTSLYWLTVLFCPGIHLSLPNDKCSVRIENVSVDNPLLLKQMLSDETISSIEDLSIVLFEGDSIDDEVFESLTSLKRLYLRDCNITHIPVHLKNLASLQTMALNNCPNLHEMESLPKNLLRLEITDCPTLLEKFNSSGLYRVWCDEGTSTVKFPTYGKLILIPWNKPILHDIYFLFSLMVPFFLLLICYFI